MRPPLRGPAAGAWPMPMTSPPPRAVSSPMRTQTFVVPMSIATSTGWSGTAASHTFSPRFPMPEKVARIAWTLQEMPSDDSDVLEDPPAEGEERDQVEVDPEAVAEEREGRREEGVRVEPGKEDARVEVALELGARGTEERIERGEDPDGGIAGPLARGGEGEGPPREHPGG